MVRPLIVPPTAVRALVARLYLGDELAPTAVGTIVLRPHQRAAVHRLRRALAEHGGALLADDVGLGKTYAAATLAREFARVLVVAPAALRGQWMEALRATDARAEFTSYTALGRGGGPPGPFDLLILDEAHHARTPSTRRYARLAALAAGARVLLLSATPIHNTRADLAALLALFLGTRAWAMDEDELARHVVRRERDDVAHDAIPEASEPQWLPVGDDEALLRQLLALPPPLPPSDGGDGGALLAWTLARQWSSSNGALGAALRRRLVRAAALDAALASGRHLSRAELTAWVCGESAVQLAFPELLAPTDGNPALFRASLAEHERAVRALIARVRESEWTDVERARLLREVRRHHPGEKVVAFTEFADTVLALFRHLHADAGVAALTGRGALVAGGTLSRAEAIRRFAPRAAGAHPPRAVERIDLLLTTDLLSEGVNLHDASVVVHLDLPWTPARMEQRVGRSRRLGALHTCTTVYALAPPASAEALLQVERRLRDKLRAAGRAVGIAGTILPALGSEFCEVSAARRRELLLRALARWAGAGTIGALPAPPDVPVAAAVRAPRRGVVALVREGDAYRLVAALDDAELDDATDTLLRAVQLASGAPAPLGEAALARAALQVDRWIARRAALQVAGAALPLAAPARRRVMRRIAAITARAPRHRRPALAKFAALARRAVTAPYGIGAERVLDELAAAEMADDAWLRALGAFVEAHGAHARAHREGGEAPRLVALLVMLPQ